MSAPDDLSGDQRQAIEAAVFRRLIEHLRAHPEAQNIDLMNLADFCRNCLSKWYVAAAAERGAELDYERCGRRCTACPTPTGRRSTRPN